MTIEKRIQALPGGVMKAEYGRLLTNLELAVSADSKGHDSEIDYLKAIELFASSMAGRLLFAKNERIRSQVARIQREVIENQ